MKVRLLHVLTDSNIGGAGIYLLSLIKALDKHKFKIYVACPKNAKIKKLLGSDITYIETSMISDRSFDIKAIAELYEIIKKHKVEIVHTHASLSGRIAAKLAGAKIVFTKHTHSDKSEINKVKRLIDTYFNNLLCDKVIAVSNFIATQLEGSGLPKNKIAIVHNGIDIKTFKVEMPVNKLKKKYGIEDEFIIGQVGRLEEEKGHKYFLQALSLIDPAKFKYKYIIAGTGSKEEWLKEFVDALNIGDHVIFTGFVEDVKEIISISDIIALPSLREAFALSLAEGMIMGKPAIASNVGGVPEVLNSKCGILVEPKDVISLKNAVIKLYNNRDLVKKMSEECKKTIETKFSISKMAEKIEKVYLELMLIK